MLIAMIATPMTALDLVGLNVFLVGLVNLVARLRVVAWRDHHHRNHHRRSYAGVVEAQNRREVPRYGRLRQCRPHPRRKHGLGKEWN